MHEIQHFLQVCWFSGTIVSHVILLQFPWVQSVHRAQNKLNSYPFIPTDGCIDPLSQRTVETFFFSYLV